MVIDSLWRACWVSIQERVHVAKMAELTAISLASLGKGEAASKAISQYIELTDPFHDSSILHSVEKSKKVLMDLAGKQISITSVDDGRDHGPRKSERQAVEDFYGATQDFRTRLKRGLQTKK